METAILKSNSTTLNFVGFGKKKEGKILGGGEGRRGKDVPESMLTLNRT
ncbi:MAG: hypothetical protein IPG78_02195 [Ignavibacteria bacterium]|nr:hypothetical protein [Ignavibacteria bacterium]